MKALALLILLVFITACQVELESNENQTNNSEIIEQSEITPEIESESVPESKPVPEVEPKKEQEIRIFKSKKDVNFPEKTLLQSFKNLFTSYSKSFNNVYNRKGRLFLEAFKKIEVNDESYLSYLICYIHRNPIHHGLVDDYAKWKFSSYNTFLSNKPTNVIRKYVLSIFGNLDEFVNFHKMNKTKKGLKEFIVE